MSTTLFLAAVTQSTDALAETLGTTAETLSETMEAMAQAATEATEAGLDIHSIKEIMDGFDPAALLPELSKVFGSLATVCRFAVMAGPVVLLALGLLYLFLSPKEANYYFGYRCYFGMGSVRAWRFTQRLAGVVLGGLGLILTIVMALISGGFAAMAVTDMVWKAVDCLIWQAVLAIAATLVINLTVAYFFDKKGNFRRRSKKK